MYVEVRHQSRYRGIAKKSTVGETGKNEAVEPTSDKKKHRIVFGSAASVVSDFSGQAGGSDIS